MPTVLELKQMCKDKGIKGFSKLNKHELEELCDKSSGVKVGSSKRRSVVRRSVVRRSAKRSAKRSSSRSAKRSGKRSGKRSVVRRSAVKRSAKRSSSRSAKRSAKFTSNEFLYAVQIGDLKKVKYLVSQGADVRHNNNLPIKLASRNGHLEVVKYLVSQGADIRSGNNFAIKNASQKGHLAMVKYLVSQGADFRIDNDYPIRIAFQNGHVKVVKYLVSLGVEQPTSDTSKPKPGRAHSPPPPKKGLLTKPVRPPITTIEDMSTCPAYDIDLYPCPEDDKKIFKTKMLRLHPDKNLGCYKYAEDAFKYYSTQCRKN